MFIPGFYQLSVLKGFTISVVQTTATHKIFVASVVSALSGTDV